ncbi:DUF1840 family protein [Alginatibacterium sediminis]|uniref:DUF1840 family protein n=1 Tax=Alginatibacterium sediminis TaxID=2164068 RepID=A0A420EBM9_9ALTE|nr:DUF1840 family protein [Alginatibacterium sediminis]RKF18064.1 DUF1840 family protein [Alginatibacterium sediminis]
MLVTFKSANHGDIVMFGSDAQLLIHCMGCSGKVPGAIHTLDIPEAKHQLTKRLKIVEETTEEIHPHSHWQPNLNHRAYPLYEMLENAEKYEDIVYWV